MPEYTLLAVLAVIVAVVFERWSRVHLFGRPRFWLSIGIVLVFQVLVDGWLTKLSAPIVHYAPSQHLGWRFPWDIPVEDFLFGFSMITAVIVLWERAKARTHAATDPHGDDEGTT
jgi:lycopene cyclase domain-containing protein